jgi:hypothetical protein
MSNEEEATSLEAVYSKIAWRLIPFLAALWVVAWIDRVNIGADYFKASGVTLPGPPVLDKVVIHFAIYEDKDHYHVPLLCSPWSHSTYRGS